MATYEVTAPDGSVFEVTAPDNAPEAAVMAYAKAQFAKQPKRQPTPAPKEPSLLDRHPLAAAGDTVLALGSGAVAAPVAGIAGLLQGAKNLVSPGLPAGDRVRQIQEALSYQPRTEGGQAAVGTIAAPFEALAGVADTAGEAASEATGSPAVGAGVNTGIQMIPSLIAKGVQGPVNARAARINTETAALRSQNAVRDATLRSGRDAGYVVPPSAVNPSFLNKRLESLAGKAAVGQEAQIRNQAVTNRLAREEAGLPPDTAITPESLAAVRSAAAAPYREVSALPPVPNPNPLAGQFGVPKNKYNPAVDLEELKKARQTATAQFRHYRTTADPAALEKARTALAEAERLDAGLEEAARVAGRPDLIPMLRAARQQIAKTYDVERALNLGDANVDPRSLGRTLDNKPMSGGLRTAGQMAQAFEPYMREASKVQPPGVSKLGPVAAAAFGMGGAAMGGTLGAAAAGLPLLSHPARSLVLSPMYQRLMAHPNYADPITLSPAQVNTLAGLLAAMQAQQK